MTSWFRSWHGAPTDTKWLMIAQRANAKPVTVIATVWALMDHASQNWEDRGSVTGWCHESFAAFAGVTSDEVLNIFEALCSAGIITDNRLKAWEKRQPKREDNSAERTKRYRERQRNETQCDAPVTQGDTHREQRTDTDTERKKKKEARATRLPDDWEPNADTTIWVMTELGWNEKRGRAVVETFRDYWHAEGGQRARKVDWDLTFKNWCRREGKQSSKPNSKTGWGEAAMEIIENENRNSEMGESANVLTALPVAKRG